MADPCMCSCNRMHRSIRLVCILLSSYTGAGFLSPPVSTLYLRNQITSVKSTALIRRVAVAGNVPLGAGTNGKANAEGVSAIVKDGASGSTADVRRPMAGASASSKTPSERTSSPSGIEGTARANNVNVQAAIALPADRDDRDVTAVAGPKAGVTIGTKAALKETKLEKDLQKRAATSTKELNASATLFSETGGNSEPAQRTKKETVIGPGKNTEIEAETMAAERVLTLVNLGLVDKEDAMAYFDALSDLERATREAKEAASASSRNPSYGILQFLALNTGQQDPLALVPFPVVCAALGVAGMHSLHLSGEADTVAAVFGGAAGAAVGGVVVVGNNASGRAVRGFGSTISGSIASVGSWAGKEISTLVAGALVASTTAAQKTLVEAPVSLAGALISSITGNLSAAVGFVLGLPGLLAQKAVQEAQGALQRTSEAAVKLPAELAREAVDAAGGALQSTSGAAANAVKGSVDAVKDTVSAVKKSPNETAKNLQEVVSSPEKVLGSATSLLNRSTGKGAPQKVERREVRSTVGPAASAVASVQRSDITTSSESADKKPDKASAVELEAKMSSVQEALERFDAVKSRIENARRSGTLREEVSLTPDRATVAREGRDGTVPTAATESNASRGLRDETRDVRIRPLREPKPSAKPQKSEPMDEAKRKRVAETLLEKASQQAVEAKAGLAMAAATIRRNSESRVDLINRGMSPTRERAAVESGSSEDKV